jgi:hypothetical protein
MVGACEDRGLNEPDEESRIVSLLLVGVAPIVKPARPIQLGWYGLWLQCFNPDPGYVGWITHTAKPAIDADILHVDKEGWNTASGDAGFWLQKHATLPQMYCNHTMELWARASNAVQYRRPGSHE